MVVPNAEQIESAMDRLKNTLTSDLFKFEKQRKELQAAVEHKVQILGASGFSSDLIIGYQLGLETARVVIDADPRVSDPFNVL